MRPEPPPLETGSDAARILHAIWTGQPIVHDEHATGTVEIRDRFLEIAPAVVAHLTLRRHYRVTVVTTAELVEPGRAAIGKLVGGRPPWMDAGLNSPHNGQLVAFVRAASLSYAQAPTLRWRRDLVIATSNALTTGDQFLGALASGHQVLLVGRSYHLGRLPDGPQRPAATPLDLEIAGAPA